MDERPDNSEQLMDILLVMDKDEKTIQAVSGVQDGKLQTKNPLEDNNDLLKVDRHGDMFSNFFSNLWNQLKDPTRFHFFRVPEEDVKRVAEDFRQTAQNPTPEGQARMRQYEVQPPQQAQQQSQTQQTQPTTGQQHGAEAPQQRQPQEQQQPQYKYDVDKIDWDTLANLGVKREQIEQNGMLDQMLKGFQTDKTVRVYFNLASVSHSNDSQLSLRENPDGRLVICSHGILDPSKLQQQFFGHTFTKEDGDAIKTAGNMGRIVELTNRAGEKVPSLISRNQKTNELASFPADKVRIPPEKNGHTFTPDEIARLKNGEAIVCKFQTKPKEGQEPKTYDAPVQFSAAKMQLELLFGERAKLVLPISRKFITEPVIKEIPDIFRKQKLTEKARLELESGGTVKVTGLVDKKGKLYHGYITWSPDTGKTNFMFPKDYKAAMEEGRAKPAIENEVQVAVNSQGKTTEATKSLQEALQSEQTKPTGEQKQRQDRKQEQKEEKKEEQKQKQDKPKRTRGVGH